MTYFPFGYKKPEVKFVHISSYIQANTTENNCSTSHTKKKHDCISGLHIFNWNTSATGHTQATAVFPKREPLPRSTTNSSQYLHLHSLSF